MNLLRFFRQERQRKIFFNSEYCQETRFTVLLSNELIDSASVDEFVSYRTDTGEDLAGQRAWGLSRTRFHSGSGGQIRQERKHKKAPPPTFADGGA